MAYEVPKPWKKCRMCGVTQPVESPIGGMNVVKIDNSPDEYECKNKEKCRSWGRDGKAFDTGQTPMRKPPYTPETNPSNPVKPPTNGAQTNGAQEKA